MRLSAVLLLSALSLPVQAAELGLNDIPRVLDTLRDCGAVMCGESKAMAIISNDGKISINFDNRRGIDAWGRGATVGAALADLAGKLNTMGADSKSALGRLAPLLPTQ